jgi:hypothetical protein
MQALSACGICAQRSCVTCVKMSNSSLSQEAGESSRRKSLSSAGSRHFPKEQKLKHISGTRVPTCHKKVLSGIS